MRVRGIIRTVFTFPITLYQKAISPLLPASCIYYPTCSVYFKLSVHRFGIIRGTLLGVLRLLRCTDFFFTGGDDDVPDVFTLAGIFKPYGRFAKRRKKRR